MDLRKNFYDMQDVAVYGIEFNRPGTKFVAACEDGFRVFDSASCNLILFQELDGALQFASIGMEHEIFGLIGRHRSPPRICTKGWVCNHQSPLWYQTNFT
jgi:hypothetical protein